MKFKRPPTRRKPVRKTLSAKLFNKPRRKKQRAAAGAAPAEDMEESGINISRSLSIIFAIHIVAIGMIFIHKQYLAGKTETPEAATSAKTTSDKEVRSNSLPKLSNKNEAVLPQKGDNYTIMAARYGVEESALREANKNANFRPGMVVQIPQGNRIVAEAPPEETAIRNQSIPSSQDQGLVEILPPADSSAQLVRPQRAAQPAPVAKPVVASGRTHIIKSGDNIWRIANKYKVSQQELLKLNKITDPTKLKIGQVIKLP